MRKPTATRTAVLLAHAFVGWALCFAAMGVGQAVTNLQTALVVHAIAAPLIFCGVSSIYFRRFAYTTPFQTAIAFTSFVIVTDLFLVAVVILRSLAMFASPLGTWLPFALIFGSTWATGVLLTGRLSAARPHRTA